MQMDIVTINSFDEYIAYTEKYKGQCYFRGQANAQWDISPSIARQEQMQSLDDEQRIIADNTPQDSNKLSFLRIPKTLATLFRMQHYGTPTRICDLTVSNLCALYFAVESIDCEDGAVYLFDSGTAIDANGFEMQIFSKVFDGEHNLSALQREADGLHEVEKILSRNYIVKHKEMLFNNSRSFLQGGTGIVFGYGCESGKLTLLGNANVNELITAKIIIPKHVKNEICNILKNLGYTKETLHDTAEGYQFEDVSIFEVEFEAKKGIDGKEKFYWVEGKYQVSTIYFDPDVLATKIARLYRTIYARYGGNARVMAFFYFDESDLSMFNWVCRGEWEKDGGFHINWNKHYFSRRLHSLNTEVAPDDAIKLAIDLVNQISPIYERLKDYIAVPIYDIAGLFALNKALQPGVLRIRAKAHDFPHVDFETRKFTDKAIEFVYDAILFTEEIEMYSNRPNMSEPSIRWIIEQDIKRHDASQNDYIAVSEK